jgi:cell division protein FtsB
MSDKDLIIGKVEALYQDRNAAWEAYFKSEYRQDEMQDEIIKLKEKIRRLEDGLQKPRKLAKRNLPKRRLRK